jgi:heme-degrading monooxygenase HmoA
MILEIATLDVKPGHEQEFESDFAVASEHISGAQGYVVHELHRCIETPGRYVLLAWWETLADHTEGFRKSPGYLEWKQLLHPYYEPFPTVEHFTLAYSPASRENPAGSPRVGTF